MKKYQCGMCGGPLVFLGKLGFLKWFKCRDCGMQVSRANKKRIKKEV